MTAPPNAWGVLGNSSPTGYPDLDHWIDHDGGEDIPWDEAGDAMHWTASEGDE